MKISTGKVFLSVFAAIAIMVIAQLAADMLPVALGLPPALGYVLAGVVYTLLGFFLLKLYTNKVLKLELSELRISALKLKPLWVVISVLLPLGVTAVFLLLPGQWSRGEEADAASVITSAVFLIGISAGVVEETLFRGLLMTVLQKRWNTAVAVIAPSVVFALLHVLNGPIDVVSFLMLLLAGTTVGVMFSMITLATGSVWNGALVHAVWNAVIIGGVLRVGTVSDEASIFNYTILSDSLLLTGGDFGIEASVISIAGYLAVICLAAARLRGNGGGEPI